MPENPDMASAFGSRKGEEPRLWCECTNCTERWTEDRDGIGTIRCPACYSKNVEIIDPEVSP